MWQDVKTDLKDTWSPCQKRGLPLLKVAVKQQVYRNGQNPQREHQWLLSHCLASEIRIITILKNCKISTFPRPSYKTSSKSKSEIWLSNIHSWVSNIFGTKDTEQMKQELSKCRNIFKCLRSFVIKIKTILFNAHHWVLFPEVLPWYMGLIDMKCWQPLGTKAHQVAAAEVMKVLHYHYQSSALFGF